MVYVCVCVVWSLSGVTRVGLATARRSAETRAYVIKQYDYGPGQTTLTLQGGDGRLAVCQ